MPKPQFQPRVHDNAGDSVRALTLRAHVPPPQIVYVTQLLESYEGVAILRTLSFDTGEVEFWVMESQRGTFEGLLEEMEREGVVRPQHWGLWNANEHGL